MKVKLDDVIQVLEIVGEDVHSFYNVKTGEIETIFTELDGTDVLDEYFYDDDYIGMPSKFDIHEYSMIEAFAYSKDNDELIYAIKGRGAFRRFKDTAIRLGLIDEWYQFRDQRYKKVAIEWCEYNGIEYEE